MYDDDTMCGEQQPEQTVDEGSRVHGRVHTCGLPPHRGDEHECWCNHAWVGARVELGSSFLN